LEGGGDVVVAESSDYCRYGSGLVFFGVDGGWRYMFLMGAFPAAVLLASLTAIPESPRWLVAQNRPEDAKQVLKLLSASPDDADQVCGVVCSYCPLFILSEARFKCF